MRLDFLPAATLELNTDASVAEARPVNPPPIPLPADETERLQALRAYMLLDTEADADFDLLAELAAALCGTPYAFISLVDEDRVWYKSRHGRAVVQNPRQLDYCAWSILQPEGLDIADLRQDARTALLPPTVGPNAYRMYSGANLVSSSGHCVGVLCVLDTQVRQLDGRQRQLLARLARQVVALMELRLRDVELEHANSALRRLALEDELTGLRNRRALLAELEREFNVCRRYGSPLSVLMLDLDHFKYINDRHGHAVGDAVLRGLGGLLREGLRQVDLPGRLGGEEFAVLLPGSAAEGALQLAEVLRQRIEAARFAGAETLCVTASLGLASYAPEQADAAELLRLADAALYRAKLGGRNRVAC
ncbi:diguanylate cyclase with GAF sensor [Roseateles asaccharophilus]|uniref:diguanylate cyclase n=1 Tax=Roseateles asaccharophilus TaxID=582607 RepID=A0A4R6N747_9BURK|nr:diguanylate cyclase with GAF sensor [Roseateles asaccharophilus]